MPPDNFSCGRRAWAFKPRKKIKQKAVDNVAPRDTFPAITFALENVLVLRRLIMLCHDAIHTPKNYLRAQIKIEKVMRKKHPMVLFVQHGQKRKFRHVCLEMTVFPNRLHVVTSHALVPCHQTTFHAAAEREPLNPEKK
jgi:hypothetical protein